MTDDELIAVARAVAAARGKDALDDARITRHGAQAQVLLSDPAYARGAARAAATPDVDCPRT
jgi:hypothetical protein